MKIFVKSLMWTFFLFLISACNPANPILTEIPSTPLPTNQAENPSTQEPSPSPTVVMGTVSIWHAWDESELPALATIIKAFQRQYPEVYFDVNYISSSDLLERYKEETIKGSGPSIVLGPVSWGKDLYQTGLIEDLSKWAGRSLLDTLNQPALEASLEGETLVGLPYSLQGVVLFRNKDVLTLKADQVDDLVILAQTSTQGDVLGAYLERSFFYSAAHLEGLGGRLMDPTGSPAFNTQEGQTWIELMQLFEQAGPTSFQTDDDLQMFKEGKVGVIIEGTWNLPALVEALGADKLAIDSWPRYASGSLSGFVQSENIYMSSKIQGYQQVAAWEFIQFLLSPSAQTTLGEIGRIPAASGSNLTQLVNGQLINQAMIAIANGVPYPDSPYLDLYEVQLNIALQSAFEGSPPAAVLQFAQAAIQEEILLRQPTPTPTP